MNDFSHYPRFQELQGKKILSIDFGSKVIGSALFNPGIDPFPYPFLKIIFKSEMELLKNIAAIIEDESVEVLVLGIPYYLDGKESTNTLAIKKFGEKLKNNFPDILYFEQDETLTTKAAEERMMNSPQYNFKIDPTKIDCVSATIILEDFIRSEKNHS